jgi:preprotein translocase subunit SecF
MKFSEWFDWSKRDLDFMGTRVYFIGVSVLLCAACLFALWKPGLKLGTDFLGGTEVEVGFTQPTEPLEIRNAVEQAGFSSAEVVRVDNKTNPHQFLIRVQEVSTLTDEQKTNIEKALCLIPEEGELDAATCPEELRTTEVKFSPGGDKVTVRYLKEVCGKATAEVACPPREDIAQQLGAGKVPTVELRLGANNPVVQNPRNNTVEFFLKSKGDQIMDSLRASLGTDKVPASPLRVEWIGPKAGKQLRDAAIISITLSLIVIMLYVTFRFDVRFAPGGIVALMHDVLIAVGAMVVTQREMTLSTVAALLTVVGFSMNDTVVIYDRIRENLGKYRHLTFPQLINKSVTETLSRTFRTSTTAMASIIPFMFWGTQVIKDFAFAMFVGMIAGIYSTIFIASPITDWLDRKFFGRKLSKRKRVRRKKKPAPSQPGEKARVPA